MRRALEVAYNYSALEAYICGGVHLRSALETYNCGGVQFRRAIELDVNKEAVSNT